MLIINTSSRQLGKNRKILLYVNNKLVDELYPNQVKKYALDKGTYEIVVKMQFYRSPVQVIEVSHGNENFAFEMNFRENFKYLGLMLVLGAVGIGIDYFIRTFFASVASIHTWANLFIVTYFILLFVSNSWINKYKYLKLIPIDM